MTIEDLEKLRKKIILKKLLVYITIFTIDIIFILVSLYLYYYDHYSFFQFKTFWVFILLILNLYVFKYFIPKYNIKEIELIQSRYKDLFIKQILSKIFSKVEYNKEFGISKYTIDRIGLMYTGERFSSNDYIKGVYKNVNVEESDIKVERIHYTNSNYGDKYYYESVLKGQWLIFDFNKEFNSSIQIVSRWFYCNNMMPSNKNNFKRIELESDEFNNLFKVYAQDEEEAFYILTPDIINGLVDLCKNVLGGVMICFVKNQLHICLYTNKDLFEINLWHKLDINYIEKNIINDIRYITDFVDILNLNNNLFKDNVR